MITFKEVVIKNFKFNIRNYSAFFLSCVFCVTVLFSFINLSLNDGFSRAFKYSSVIIVMNLSIVALSIFVILYTSYSLSSFLKQRSKEFGLFLVLGMNKKDLSKLVVIETAIIVFSSLITGLLIGTGFSLILFKVLIYSLGLEIFNLKIKFTTYFLVTIIFIVIFMVEILFIHKITKKYSLLEYLRKDKEPEYLKKPNYNISAIVFFLGSFFCSFTFLNLRNYLKEHSGFEEFEFFKFLVPMLISIYMIMSQILIIFQMILKNFERTYNNNLLSLREINNKFVQNKKIMFVSTVLGILVIFFLGTIYSLFMDMNNIASMNQKYNIMYSDFEDKRKVPDDKLTELINDNKLKLKNKVCIEYLYPLVEDDFSSEYQPILSKSIYNNLTNSNLAINSGEIVRLNMNGDKDKPLPEVYPFDTFTLKFGNEIFSFKFKAPEERNIVINYDVQPSKWLLIINDDDFEKIKSEVNINFKRVFIAIDFYEWKETSQLVHDIKKELDYEDEYSKYPVNDERNKDILGISSRIDYYNTIKKEISMTLFIVAFLGGVFLLCSGSITYFKVITNITEKKEKYIKLRKIGITKNEFKKMIKSELKVIFFIPLVFSSMISTILIYILYISSLYPERFSRNMLLVIIYYSFFQVIYYLLAKVKYIKSII